MESRNRLPGPATATPSGRGSHHPARRGSSPAGTATAPSGGPPREEMAPRPGAPAEDGGPAVGHDEAACLETILARRRSARTFAGRTVEGELLRRLAWAAQGVTDGEGHRTTPSAGACYPLEVLVVTQEGVTRFDPPTGSLLPYRAGDRKRHLAAAAWDQPAVAAAPAVLAIVALYARSEAKYGPVRGPRYVAMEAGHACQNVLLEATALGLVALPVGAFDERRVQSILGLPPDHRPLYLVPVGYPP